MVLPSPAWGSGRVDQALARVLVEAQHEREEVLGGALARRTEAVRLILDGAPIGQEHASDRLALELAHQLGPRVLTRP
jgi:hypothetical protein